MEYRKNGQSRCVGNKHLGINDVWWFDLRVGICRRVSCAHPDDSRAQDGGDGSSIRAFSQRKRSQLVNLGLAHVISSS